MCVNNGREPTITLVLLTSYFPSLSRRGNFKDLICKNLLHLPRESLPRDRTKGIFWAPWNQWLIFREKGFSLTIMPG